MSALAVGLLGLTTPAIADHVTGASATQVENQGLSVTIQFDVSFTNANFNGQIGWTTGDGGDAVMPDGVVRGAYSGDASGGGTFNGSRPAGAGTTYAWVRTSPSPGVARTRVTYSYATAGGYAVQWQACGPCVTGVLVVTVAGSSVADCTVDTNNMQTNSITYDPAITAPLVPQRVAFVLDVELDCVGSAPAAGVYDLHITGMTSETCQFGQSDDARVTGTKSTNQPLSGTGGRWNHHREGIHLFGYPDPSRPQQSGEFYLDGSPTRYELNLWLDLPVTAAACPATGGRFSWGHATIRT